ITEPKKSNAARPEVARSGFPANSLRESRTPLAATGLTLLSYRVAMPGTHSSHPDYPSHKPQDQRSSPPKLDRQKTLRKVSSLWDHYRAGPGSCLKYQSSYTSHSPGRRGANHLVDQRYPGSSPFGPDYLERSGGW